MPPILRVLALPFALLLAPAGASGQPAASAPTGPTASITDTTTGGGTSGGVFFVLAEVDGKPVRTAIESSQLASFGQGAYLRLVGEERPVPAGRVKLKLVGRVVQAALIGEIFSAIRNDPVTGVLDVELQPGMRYRVTGVWDTFRREVWLEEEATRQLVGEKFVQAPPAQDQTKMAEATSFTCCNLHYHDGWISDGNWTALPFIPAGSRVRFVDWGRYRANVLIEGRKMSIGVDIASAHMTREQYYKKVVVDENPAPRIAAWPAEVQAAVRAGKVMPGMTREQVIVSLGPPRPDRTQSLDALEWTMFANEREEYSLVWGEDGKLKSVEAALRLKRQVLAAP